MTTIKTHKQLYSINLTETKKYELAALREACDLLALRIDYIRTGVTTDSDKAAVRRVSNALLFDRLFINKLLNNKQINADETLNLLDDYKDLILAEFDPDIQEFCLGEIYEQIDIFKQILIDKELNKNILAAAYKRLQADVLYDNIPERYLNINAYKILKKSAGDKYQYIIEYFNKSIANDNYDMFNKAVTKYITQYLYTLTHIINDLIWVPHDPYNNEYYYDYTEEDKKRFNNYIYSAQSKYRKLNKE